MNRRNFMKAATAASWCDLDFVRMAVDMAEHNPAIRDFLQYAQRGLGSFRPRPDDLDAAGCPDQQTAFCNSRDRVAFLIGGNGAGTSVAAAYKAARFLLQEQPPPRKNTPFWVMSNTFENTCNVCWGEKLHGMGFIPQCEIETVVYHNAARNQPKAVVLKPWPGRPDKKWVIEFKTFEQTAGAMMGASIGGFWISETPPAKLVAETARGLRDYKFDGACMIEFTPIDPWLSMEMEESIERKPESWSVYRANTLCNLPNLPGGQEWIDTMLAFTPPELHATRLFGDFAVFEGMIYPGLRDGVHFVDCDSEQGQELDERMVNDRSLVHSMGTDWGWTSEHAHCTVWVAYDPADGSWYVYDEYWTISQDKIILDHVQETLDRCEQWNWPMTTDMRGRKRIDLEQRPGYRVNHADSAGRPHITMYSQRGIPTVSYRKTPGSVVDGIYYLKMLLSPDQRTGKPLLRISSRCKHLIDEMRKYRWKRGPPNMMALNPALAKPEPVSRFDHGPDALRYVLCGQRIGEGWQSNGKQHDDRRRIANRNANIAMRGVNDHRPIPSGNAAGLVRFER